MPLPMQRRSGNNARPLPAPPNKESTWTRDGHSRWSSAAKPAKLEHFVVASYNIGWSKQRLDGKKWRKHWDALSKDLRAAMDVHGADLILLCECGEIDEGLGQDFEKMVRTEAGPGYIVNH